MEFKYISDRDILLDKVIELGDANRNTLGHLPRGAFKEMARKRFILGAVEDGELLGYLIFRINQGRRAIVIVHLCVSSLHRGKGVSTRLLDRLKSELGAQFSSMGLTCRDDYEHAINFWKRYGFQPGYSKRSRSIKENFLTYWHLPLGGDLFSEYQGTASIKAVLDANIVIKLRDDDPLEQVQALKADWITKEVEFYSTKELLNEFHRDANIKRRNKSLEYVRRQFLPLEQADSELCSLLYEEVCTFLHDEETPNNISDRNQIVEAIASETPYFITLDQAILDCSEQLLSEYGLAVMSPLEFIISIDQIENYSDYQSIRLGGVDIEYRKAKYEEFDEVKSALHNSGNRENKEEFVKLLSKISASERCTLKIVKKKGKLLGALGYEVTSTHLIVHLLRTDKTNLGGILFKQLVSEVIRKAKESKIQSIHIENKYLSDERLNILASVGFKPTERLWVKRLLFGLCEITVMENQFGDDYNLPEDSDKIYSLERSLYPAKAKGLDIPTYIVPIRAYWATQLFDYVSANASILGSKPELTWNRENVYYRSARQRSLVAPGRILWYLSGKDNNARNQCVIACSYLDDVDIGKPKELYSKYKRLGVYEWKHLYELAGESIDTEVMALCFSDTEVFTNPLPLSTVQRLLKKKATFQSPLRVSNTIFETVYSIANGLQ